MILKWKSFEGVWHMIDGVSDIIDHGWCSKPEIHELAKKYSGDDSYLYWTLDAVASDKPEDMESKYHYVKAMIRNKSEHLVIENHDFYVLSDQGKTIDNLN